MILIIMIIIIVIHNVKAVVIPIVVGALGKVSNELEKRIDVPLVVPCLQKTALLGTAFILRRVLGISEFE